MKAVRIHGSAGAGELRLEEIQPPKVLADDEVLVRIRDAGVNPFDLAPSPVPHTLGRDFAGQVMAVGDAVRGLGVNDRVFGFADGSYAEFAALPVRLLARMPKSVDFDEAAALPTPGLTAYQLMMHEVQVEPGQRILVRGAASAAGVLAVQLAQWKGAEVLTRAQGRVDAIADVLSFVVQPNGTQLAIVAGLVDAGVLRPPLGRVLPLSDARLALELARGRGAPGKIVLSVSHP